MEFSVEDVSSVKKTFHVEVPLEKVSEELDKAYNDLRKNVKIKGFRKGKATRSVLQRHYGKDVNSEVRQKLIQESFSEIFSKGEYKIVGDAELDPPELDPKAPFRFDITIEVAPEIDDLDYKGLQLTRTIYEISDEEVEKQLNILQKTMTEKRKIEEDRPARQGDFVLIGYQGTKQGQPIAELPKSENFSMKLGSGIIHKDLDDQIEGMSEGEHRQITVTFPESYQNKTLAGSEIMFHVELKEIQEEVLHELDDEFAKKLGPYETIEDVEKAIRDNLKEGYEKRTEQELNEQAFSALLEKNDFEVPESLVKSELDQIISDIESNVAAHDKTFEELGFTVEGLREKHRDTAVKQAKRHLLLGKLMQQENLELTDEELDEGFAQMAQSFRQPPEMIKEFYKKQPDKMNVFRHALLEKKAMNLIIESSEIKDKEPEPVPEKQEDSGE